MASSNPPVKGAAYATYVSLTSQADGNLFQTSVTLATGDVTVSKDGGSFANIGTLPVEISTTGVLALVLTATEMDADTVVIRFRDASGAEWADLLVTIHTVAANFDSLVADTEDIQARIPAVLVSGRIDASAGALADDVIRAGAYDESTAFPLTAADSGSTALARTGADADTLKTLSDEIATAQTAIDAVPTNGELATALSPLATAANLATVAGYIDTEVAAIKAKTDNLPASPAATGDIPSAAAVRAEIDSNSTQLVAIKAVTDAIPDAGALTALVANIAAILADTGTDGVVLSAATQAAIADVILGRSVANVEDSATVYTIAGLILAAFEGDASTGTLVINKTDGATQFATRTLTTDPDAEPIVSVS